MSLPRLQFVELEDLPWFPHTIRELATDYLHFIETRFALHKPVVSLLRGAIAESRVRALVDLCSGAGGFVPAIYEALTAAGIPVKITLTDKFPNLTAFRQLTSLYPESILHVAEPLEANQIPPDLPGMRTMFNAFHHFSPAIARSVLECAVEASQPICIFEIPERRLANILPLFLTPLFVAIATPFIRPFQWRRLLWTYLLPLVPLMCWWDGLVSQLRAYTVDELLDLTRGLDGYRWKAGRVAIPGSLGHVTYLLGALAVPYPTSVTK